jgi:putative hydrolase of the HAD superfamily
MIFRMRKAGLKKENEAILREKYPFTGFRIIARELKMSPRMQQIGMSIYEEMDLSGIKPYDDVDVIARLGQKKALVTSGTKIVQMEKIRILGIKHLFSDIVVDEAISVEGRREIFSELAKQYDAQPREVMIIGDNPEVELAAGQMLGMVTVQIVRRDNVLKGHPDYQVKDLYAVEKLLERL